MPNVRRCFNCGERDHVGADCPSKSLDAKCFTCGKFGHVASKCPKEDHVTMNSCTVEHSSREKCIKDVEIDGVKIEALIDTGSDISLMRADEYVKMGSPRLQASRIHFSGIGLGEDRITALGEFRAQITIDEHSYPILIRIVSDTVL